MPNISTLAAPEEFKTTLARFAFETPTKKSSPDSGSRLSIRKKIDSVQRSRCVAEVVIQTPKKEENGTGAIDSPTGELTSELTQVTLDSPLRRSTRIRSTPSLIELVDIKKDEENSTIVERPKILKRASTSQAGGSSPKKKRGYAPPEVYAHLNFLPDCMAMDIKVLFCGINPGQLSAARGHHFAHPNNHFWKCLHESGMVDKFIPSDEDYTLPERYGYGLTNLVDRPSAEEAELSGQEKLESVPAFFLKIIEFRPMIVCFVGKGIWLIVEKALQEHGVIEPEQDSLDNSKEEGKDDNASPPLSGNAKPKLKKSKRKPKPETKYGMQPYQYVHPEEPGRVRRTLFFMMPSSSGRVTSHTKTDKVKLYQELQRDLNALVAGTFDLSSLATIPPSFVLTPSQAKALHS